MALTPISNSVEFVQDNVPTTAADGDSWLDTSLSPPRLKVFDDAVGAFVRPRSVQNLDAPVSGAGATQTDIKTAVDNSNTGATVSSNLDAPVSAAGADLSFIGGFQLSLASFLQLFDISGQSSSPTGVAFNGDGTAMFIIGGGFNTVFQYSLSTGFDIGTASFTGNSLDVLAQDSDPRDVAFNGDGTSMFVMGRGSTSVLQYSLSTGFDIGTASFTGTSFDVSGEDEGPTGVAFNGDGTSMFVMGGRSKSVIQYSLSTGFDVGTASFNGNSFEVSSQDDSPTGVAFNGDGTSMFVIGASTNSVYQYFLSNEFDVDSASFSGISFNVSSQDSFPTSVAFNGDGTSMFVTGDSKNLLLQYLVGDVGPK